MRKLKNEELDRVEVEAFKKLDKNPVVVVLDNIRSMHNVGSAFRTADAFRAEKIVLCGITAQPPHREINKTALGAAESVDWTYEENTVEAIQKLKKEGYQIFSVEQADKSTRLNEFLPEKDQKCAFVFGNEVFGVEDEVIRVSDGVIEIPQFGTKHSLNVSVSIGVVVWDVLVKLGAVK